MMMGQGNWYTTIMAGADIELLVSWLCGALLGVLCLTDCRKRLIPNVMVWPAWLLFLWIRLMFPLEGETFATHVVAMLFAFVLLYMTAIATKGGVGGGDIKLASLLGLVVGKTYIIALLLVAGICAITLVILLGRQTRMKEEGIPFACCLTVGWFLTYVGKVDVLRGYITFFLP